MEQKTHLYQLSPILKYPKILKPDKKLSGDDEKILKHTGNLIGEIQYGEKKITKEIQYNQRTIGLRIGKICNTSFWFMSKHFRK